MKSFQQALEKRVSGLKNIKFDKHTILKATQDVVSSLFGNLGKSSIQAADWQEGTLILQCEKSTWRTETILNKSRIIEGVNSKCGSKVISQVRIRGM